MKEISYTHETSIGQPTYNKQHNQLNMLHDLYKAK